MFDDQFYTIVGFEKEKQVFHGETLSRRHLYPSLPWLLQWQMKHEWSIDGDLHQYSLGITIDRVERVVGVCKKIAIFNREIARFFSYAFQSMNE